MKAPKTKGIAIKTERLGLLRSYGRAFAAAVLLTVTAPSYGIEPETISVATLPDPTETWVMARDGLGTMYIFDSATGDMQGLLGLTPFTAAVEMNLAAGEFYAAESYYSRLTNGERTDVVRIYDVPTLSPKVEIEVPKKIAALPFRRYIALMDDKQYLSVFNLTPAQSVSIVDLKNEKFVTELSTPGCALTIPVPGSGFTQLCGDGKIQLIRLDANGEETSRTRSRSFFKVDEDPVFDKTTPTQDGWLYISYQGQVFNAVVDDDEINVSEPWSLLTDEQRAENWRPGGGQFFTYHQAHDLLFVLMNNASGFSHDHAGDEVWIFDRSEQRLINRLPLAAKGSNLFVSRTHEPLLSVSGGDGQLHVFDVATMKLTRTIAEVGRAAGYLQGVTH